MHSDRAARLRRMSIPDNGETRPSQRPESRAHTKSAPPGAGVKTRPYGSPYGRILTPTPHWRLPAPAPGTQKKRTQLPGHERLDRPRPFRNAPLTPEELIASGGELNYAT